MGRRALRRAGGKRTFNSKVYKWDSTHTLKSQASSEAKRHRKYKKHLARVVKTRLGWDVFVRRKK